MFLPVNDDSCDLLVHEYQDSAEKSWDNCSYHSPPGIGANGTNNPPSIIPCWLKGIKQDFCILSYLQSLGQNRSNWITTTTFLFIPEWESLKKKSMTYGKSTALFQIPFWKSQSSIVNFLWNIHYYFTSFPYSPNPCVQKKWLYLNISPSKI